MTSSEPSVSCNFFCINNIKEHQSQITITNIIIMKKFEVLWELAKCDTETWSEQMLLQKWCQETCSTQGCHKPSTCKKLNISEAQ